MGIIDGLSLSSKAAGGEKMELGGKWWMSWVRSGVYDRIEINTKFWVNYIFQYKLPVFNPTTTGASQTCRIWLKLKYFAKI